MILLENEKVDIRITGKNTFQGSYRLMRGFHVLAKGGERSMIASISGTVTRIWDFWKSCTR